MPTESLGQLGSISAVLAGFSLTFLAVVLSRAEARRSLGVTAGAAIAAAAAFTLCALGWTGSAVWYSQVAVLGRDHGAVAGEAAVRAMHGPLSLLFVLGTFLFLAVVGLSGWLHSRWLGVFSAVVALLSMVLAVLLFRPLIAVG